MLQDARRFVSEKQSFHRHTSLSDNPEPTLEGGHVGKGWLDFYCRINGLSKPDTMSDNQPGWSSDRIVGSKGFTELPELSQRPYLPWVVWALWGL